MKQITDWIRGTLTDSNGNPSSKRQIAFLSFALFTYAVIAGIGPETLQIIVWLIAVSLGITIPDNFAKKR